MRINANKFLSYILQQIKTKPAKTALKNIIQYFYRQAKSYGAWDLKRQNSWKFNKKYDYIYKYGSKTYYLRSDDPGNIHFGYVGAVFFPSSVLRAGAGIYQIKSGTSKFKYWFTFFDDPRDSSMIALGAKIFGQSSIIGVAAKRTIKNFFNKIRLRWI